MVKAVVGSAGLQRSVRRRDWRDLDRCAARAGYQLQRAHRASGTDVRPSASLDRASCTSTSHRVLTDLGTWLTAQLPLAPLRSSNAPLRGSRNRRRPYRLQRVHGRRASLLPQAAAWYDTAANSARQAGARAWRVSPRVANYAPIASALIPGSGQLMLGNDRFIGYVALEALSRWKYAKDVRAAIAGSGIQAAGATSSSIAFHHGRLAGLLPDADWAYYEKRCATTRRVGSFSLRRADPVIPETDETTLQRIPMEARAERLLES